MTGRCASAGRRGEQGLTIVELLIAAFIIALTFAVLASTLISAFGGIRANETRVRATAIANEAIEELATLPWDQVGLFEGEVDDGGQPAWHFRDGEVKDGVDVDFDTFEGELLVLLEDDQGVALHEEVVETEVENLSYTVERWVTVAEDPGGEAGVSKLKRIVVIVSWNVRGVSRSVRTESLRAPDPDELLDLEISLDVRAADGTRAATLDESGEPPQFISEIDLLATIVVGDVKSTVVLSFLDRDRNPQTELFPPPPEGEQTITITIPKSSYSYRHGPETFTATATAEDGRIASDIDSIRFHQEVGVPLSEMRLRQGDDLVEELEPCSIDGSYYLDGPITIEADVLGLTIVEAGRTRPEDSTLDALHITWGPAQDDSQTGPTWDDDIGTTWVGHSNPERKVFGGRFDFETNRLVSDPNINNGNIPVELNEAVYFTIRASRVIEDGGTLDDPEFTVESSSVETWVPPVSWPDPAAFETPEDYEQALDDLPTCSSD